jgi:hypothetical protein
MNPGVSLYHTTPVSCKTLAAGPYLSYVSKEALYRYMLVEGERAFR